MTIPDIDWATLIATLLTAFTGWLAKQGGAKVLGVRDKLREAEVTELDNELLRGALKRSQDETKALQQDIQNWSPEKNERPT